MLLIYPPVVRSTEPPLGIARLAGFIRARGMPVRLLDLNHEGMEYLLASMTSLSDCTPSGMDGQSHGEQGRADTWTHGAVLRTTRNLASLRSLQTYRNLSRYSRAVGDLSRVLRLATAPFGAEASLANYAENRRTPLRRQDLLDAAARYTDSPYFRFFSRRIEEELDRQPATVVGFSINYLSQALPAFAILGWLSQVHPELRRVAGGGLVNSWLTQGSLACDDSLGGLLHALIPGRGEDSPSAWLDSAGQHVERDPKHPAWASQPDFDDFGHLEYLSPVRIIPYTFSCGCSWKRCTFCPEKAEGGRYAGLRVDDAMSQLGQLARRCKAELFHFTDNEIAPLYLRGMAEHSSGIPWYGFARFSRALLDPGFCHALAASGCRMLQLGLESADQQVLDAMGKGTELAKIDQILENLAMAGIGTFLYVLFGTPSEDLSAARKTRDFLADRADLIAFLNVAIFNLPVASTEAALLNTRDFYAGSLSLYRDFEHPAGWNRAAIRSFINRELEAEPRIRGIIKRSPPVFTSNHAVFFLE